MEEDGKYYPMMKAVQGQMKYTKKGRISLRKRASGSPASGVKRISGKEDRETKELLEKLSRVDTPFRKEAEQRAAHRD